MATKTQKIHVFNIEYDEDSVEIDEDSLETDEFNQTDEDARDNAIEEALSKFPKELTLNVKFERDCDVEDTIKEAIEDKTDAIVDSFEWEKYDENKPVEEKIKRPSYNLEQNSCLCVFEETRKELELFLYEIWGFNVVTYSDCGAERNRLYELNRDNPGANFSDYRYNRGIIMPSEDFLAGLCTFVCDKKYDQGIRMMLNAIRLRGYHARYIGNEINLLSYCLLYVKGYYFAAMFHANVCQYFIFDLNKYRLFNGVCADAADEIYESIEKNKYYYEYYQPLFYESYINVIRNPNNISLLKTLYKEANDCIANNISYYRYLLSGNELPEKEKEKYHLHFPINFTKDDFGQMALFIKFTNDKKEDINIDPDLREKFYPLYKEKQEIVKKLIAIQTKKDEKEEAKLKAKALAKSKAEAKKKKEEAEKAKKEKELREKQEMEKMIALRKSYGLCIHCGGTFKGMFKKKCSKCGRLKDY